MWVLTRGSFLAFAEHRDDSTLILIRARRSEDILRMFPEAEIESHPTGGYPFHATISRDTAALRVANHIQELDYPDFTAAVHEPGRREAYRAASTFLESWGSATMGQEPEGGFGPLEHASHPPRPAWGPLRAGVEVLVRHLEAWEAAPALSDRRKEAAWTLEKALLDLGFVPQGIHYLQISTPVPERSEIPGLTLDQSLRLLGLLQRLGKWVYEGAGFGTFMDSGLVPALIRHIHHLVCQIEGA